jgi:hypothetical protein
VCCYRQQTPHKRQAVNMMRQLLPLPIEIKCTFRKAAMQAISRDRLEGVDRLGPIDIQAIHIIAAARWTKPWK